jgi:hypothetical protein
VNVLMIWAAVWSSVECCANGTGVGNMSLRNCTKCEPNVNVSCEL